MSSSIGRPLLDVLGRSGLSSPSNAESDAAIIEESEQAKSVEQTCSKTVGTVKRITSSDECSDEALIALISGSDKDALAALFRRYARIVRAVAYRVLRDASEAEDLLQDLFILIKRKCDMFDPSRGPARFWILQMAYHCALAGVAT